VGSKSSPDKKEIAQMVVLSHLGNSNWSIARKLGRSPHTVRRYLDRHVDLKDPGIKELVDHIKAQEIKDLALLGVKARARLHELLDEGKTKAIETTAIMDRSFQQRRLLEGLSTENISTREIVEYHRANIAETKRLLAELEAEMEEED